MDSKQLQDLRDSNLKWMTNASHYGGSFIKAFAEAALNADSDNFLIVLPVLLTLRLKYPEYEKDWPIR